MKTHTLPGTIFLLICALLINVCLLGCIDRRGMHLDQCATKKPSTVDIAGVYVFDRQTLVKEKSITLPWDKCSIELNSNGKYHAILFSDELLSSAYFCLIRKETSQDEYIRRLKGILNNPITFTGDWHIGEAGTINIRLEGLKTIWGVRLRTIHQESKTHTHIEDKLVHILGNNPPHKLMIIIGDPDLNNMFTLRRVENMNHAR